MNQNDIVGCDIRGRHAASDNMLILEDDTGKRTCIKNLSTRITPDTTTVAFMSASNGTVCLRLDDNEHSDFWIEFNIDVLTLERLLRVAKSTEENL